MAVELADYLDSLKREISPPGSEEFDDVSEEEFIGHLSDAFWEGYLDGFFVDYTCDIDGTVTPVSGSIEFPRENVSVVVLYAGIRILRNKLLNTNTRFAAKAGPVEFETENSANLLTEMAKQLNSVKNRLIATKVQTIGGDVSMIDAFSARAADPATYAGYIETWYRKEFS
jgi:hypothetical protein